jgi:hypothetical protein
VAGKPGRSGGSKGRRLKDGSRGRGAGGAPFRGHGGADEPPLTSTVASIRRHARWVLAELLAGRLDPSVSREATQLHRTMLATRRQTAAEREMVELRSLVGRSERAADKRIQNAIDATKAQSTVGDGITMITRRSKPQTEN